MARWIDADELLRRLKTLQHDEHIRRKYDIVWGIGLAIGEVENMLRAEEYVTGDVPNDYPRTLDAIRNELTTAVGLVDRLREANREVEHDGAADRVAHR